MKSLRGVSEKFSHIPGDTRRPPKCKEVCTYPKKSTKDPNRSSSVNCEALHKEEMKEVL